jgi:tetratricopeptide (TPR) repeat protein
MSQELRRDMTAALGYYRKALTIREDLHHHPHGGAGKLDPVAVQQALSEAYIRVAVTALRLGDPAASLDPYRKALDLREALAAAVRKELDARPADDKARPMLTKVSESLQQDLGRTYNGLGEVSFLSRDQAAARAYYEKCLAVREGLYRASPDSPRPKAELAAACGNFGDMYLRSNDFGAARPQYDRCLALNRELADLDRQNTDYQRNLAMSLYRLGTLARCAGDREAAAAAFGECLQIREALSAKDAKNVARQVELMRVLPHGGEHVRAAAIAEQLRAGRPDQELLFEIACGYAQSAAAVGGPDDAGLRDKYTAAAVAALADAVARGYRDVVALETEPDLRQLHADPGYQELLKKVQAATPVRDRGP